MFEFTTTVSNVTPLMMLGGGLLAFLSPCVLPMLPVYALYLLGGNSGQGEGRAAWGLVLRRCLGLCVSFAVLFTVMGAGAGMIGSALQSLNRGILNMISGGLMIVFGLGMLGVYQSAGLRLLGDAKLRLPRMNGFWGAFAFGILLALSWTPCLTPLLGNALIMAASAENATMATGMVHLAIFALGLCLPMLLFMLLYEWLKGVLSWLKRRQMLLRRVGGGLMVAYGGYLILAAAL